MGPVLGSLVVSEVSSHTLNHLSRWQDQFVIAGIVGLAVAIVALFTLRELSAGMRDQVMISLQEQTVVELRARGLDVEEATRRPYQQMFKPDILGSAFAISVFLLGYYTAVAFFPIYFQTVLNFTPSQSNSLLNWYWSFNAIALIGFGAMSDRLAVRKPFMLVGALGSIMISVTFLSQGDAQQPDLQQRRDPARVHRDLGRRGVRTLDGELHRDRRAAQPRAHRDRPGGLGLAASTRRGGRVPDPSARGQLRDAAGGQGRGGPGGGHPARGGVPAAARRADRAPGRLRRRWRNTRTPRRSRTAVLDQALITVGPTALTQASNPKAAPLLAELGAQRRLGPGGAGGGPAPVAALAVDLHRWSDRLHPVHLPDGRLLATARGAGGHPAPREPLAQWCRSAPDRRGDGLKAFMTRPAHREVLATATPVASGQAHVAICNWRDLRHPEGGGCELYIEADRQPGWPAPATG